MLVAGMGMIADAVGDTCARAGFDVAVLDPTKEVTDLDAAAGRVDVVIDVADETRASKQRLLQQLDARCSPDVLLATSTCHHQVGRIAERCAHPERVLGMQWSTSSAGLTRLVEIVPTAQSSRAAVSTAVQLVEACGCCAVVYHRDVPGAVANRLRMAMFMEAIRLVDEGVASVEDVDQVARGMYRHATGPLELLDRTGLDKVAAASAAMATFYDDDRFAAAPLLATMLAHGRYGRECGRGFYEYASTDH
ncbi:3-hydroxyacyl-CoA dehydrogenase family protein [Qaidamihabitans albus]|uniref:3-hydroxyacyl-CoA dehydrogenase family protein n=1 Tax=Qaidamihabitans albus TaxID=2795733 RepID=UPI0018F1818E|nr:3-hydroxyacyl-CoA dehydrogenase family protein [Qaidamihabitans albus]